MNDERLELIVDNEDSYLDVENVFYINPNRLDLARCLTDNQFISCTIKNSPIESLSSMNFSYILKKLKPEAIVEVIVLQPLTVMQEYDAKQIEANAKLAGFTDFNQNEIDFVDSKTDKKCKTISLTFKKPIKKNSTIEVEVTVGRQATRKGQRTSDKKNYTSTSNNTYSSTSQKR